MYDSFFLVISRSSNEWQIQQIHYSDPTCETATYSMIGTGTYTMVVPQSMVQENNNQNPISSTYRTQRKYPTNWRNHEDYKLQDLKSFNLSTLENLKQFDKSLNLIPRVEYSVIHLLMQSMSLTPLDGNTVKQLNATRGGCGKAGSWKKGVEQDTTQTKGCDVLGIIVPTHYRQPVKFGSQDKTPIIFLGQTKNTLSKENHTGDVPQEYHSSLMSYKQTNASEEIPTMLQTRSQSNLNAAGIEESFISTTDSQMTSKSEGQGTSNDQPVLTTWTTPLTQCTSSRGTAHQPITASRRSTSSGLSVHQIHQQPRSVVLLVVLLLAAQ